MKLFELVTLNTVLFGAGKAAEGIQAFVNAPEAKGTLLGAWATDIGTLNDVILLRGFESLEDLLAERKRARLSDNPFCCKDLLRSWSADTYIPLEFTLPVTPGTYGRVYEIRSYVPKLDGLAPTRAGWREAVTARVQSSTRTSAVYSLDGPTRSTQVWPSACPTARAESRAKPVADGVWPPKGGPDWLTGNMTSTLAVPLPFSPLQ